MIFCKIFVHFITSVHTNPSTRKLNTALGGARTGIGDTKTQRYYLFSTHFGIASVHTNPAPTNQIQRSEVLGRALVIPKRNASTCFFFCFFCGGGATSDHTKPHSHSSYQQCLLIPYIEAHIYAVNNGYGSFLVQKINRKTLIRNPVNH